MLVKTFEAGERFGAHAEVVGDVAVGDLLEELRAPGQHALVTLPRGAGEQVNLAFHLLQHEVFQDAGPEGSVAFALQEFVNLFFADDIKCGFLDGLDVEGGGLAGKIGIEGDDDVVSIAETDDLFFAVVEDEDLEAAADDVIDVGVYGTFYFEVFIAFEGDGFLGEGGDLIHEVCLLDCMLDIATLHNIDDVSQFSDVAWIIQPVNHSMAISA